MEYVSSLAWTAGTFVSQPGIRVMVSCCTESSSYDSDCRLRGIGNCKRICMRVATFFTLAIAMQNVIQCLPHKKVMDEHRHADAVAQTKAPIHSTVPPQQLLM
jgi:hypothetical protein